MVAKMIGFFDLVRETRADRQGRTMQNPMSRLLRPWKPCLHPLPP